MSEKLITKKAVKQVLRDYWAELRLRPWQSTIALIAPGFGSILVFYVPPLIIAKLIDIFVSQQRVSFTLPVIRYIVLFAFLWLIGEILWRIGIHFLTRVEALGINALSKKSFALLTGKDYDFFTNNFVGALVKKSTAYPKNFETVIDIFSFDVFSSVIPIIFAFFILWQYSPWIPFILITCLFILIAIALPLIRKRIKLVAQRHDALSKMVGQRSDSLTNIMTVKSFAKENYEAKIFGEHVNLYTKKFKETADFQNLRYDTIVSPFYVLTNVIGLIAAILFTQNLGLTPGTIVVVFSYYANITRVFWGISKIYRSIESSISEAAEFTQLFVDPPAIQDSIDAVVLKVEKGDIAFTDVDFKYSDNKVDDDSFLSGFSLDIKAKQKVGLVGPSGGGKTTITKLLLRFIDPESGDIFVDGQSIKKITQSSLRREIAYVPQEPLLFHRSLFENIAYGDEDATKEDIIKAAKIAHADEFINQLPKGYETLVGERGIKLSGGQRQRVAIARALLKKASIIVLDEATSSLDSESEKYIQEGLWELMKDKTALVIAHRLSTIKHLDRILVLDNGKIVQDGTHDELISQDGLYAKLWSHQAGESKELSDYVLN
ncbi:MAG: ABC transporter-related protein [candidate division CPR2 bacterium GW2011_GWC1_39_9]|uniref:ABC transporter-related protein n=1 Tax=candidate division CPR2 bacterium GW2011_GWC2_39_10 TaxID=1618345 RepID=A0A0G0P5V0_UNCC2|nr:MAG: ABC transporter-related protein [candidate division CPR2 bacterium GW2011_GWC2_39_10]KKR33312.1 MAG: ABC transporter-related protein [candidate division CPR2 bacterium GW2011_GWC1_39_9]